MTDFEAIADWWDARTGDDSHRLVILPAVLRPVGDLSGRSVLDLGCGNGNVSRMLARAGASVTAIDASAALIRHAERRQQADPLGVRFLVGDAARVDEVAEGTVDLVIANMMLMDAANADAIISEVARVPRPGGRFVFSILHPCYQVPGGSSWLVERTDFEERHSVRVWRYFDVFDAPGTVAADQPTPHIYSHRPISWYAARLFEQGFVISGFEEPRPGEEYRALHPNGFARSGTIPWFLVISADKS